MGCKFATIGVVCVLVGTLGGAESRANASDPSDVEPASFLSRCEQRLFRGPYQRLKERASQSERYYLSRRAGYELSKLEGRTLSSFFPHIVDELKREADQTPADPYVAELDRVRLFTRAIDPEAAKISPQDFAPFEQYFNQVLNLERVKNNGVIGSSRFKDWARGELPKYRTRSEMGRLVREGYDLRTFIEIELGDRYKVQSFAPANASERWLETSLRNPFLYGAGTVLVSSAIWLGKILWFSTMAGTIPVYVNTYSSSVQSPLIQKVSQLGTRNWAWIAVPLQQLLVDSGNAKASVSRLQRIIDHLDLSSLSGKDPKQAEKELNDQLAAGRGDAKQIETYVLNAKQFSEMLKMSIEFQTRVGGYLPGNQQSARSTIWGSEVWGPVDLARTAAIFDTQRSGHLQLLRDAQQDLAAARKTGDAREIQDAQARVDAEQSMVRTAEDGLIASLAVWKFNLFMFPEITQKMVGEKDGMELDRLYAYMSSSFGYERYLAIYQKQVDLQLQQMHALIEERDRTAQDILKAQGK